MKSETIMLRTLFLASVLLTLGVMIAMLIPAVHPVRLAVSLGDAVGAVAPMSCPMIVDQVVCMDTPLGML